MHKDITIEDFICKRINELCKEKNMTMYKLSQISGVTQASLSIINSKKCMPSVATVAKICKGLGISYTEFFKEDTADTVVTHEERLILKRWNRLNEREKELLLAYADGLLVGSQPETLKEHLKEK